VITTAFIAMLLISGGMFIIFQPLYDCSNKNFKSGQPSYPSNLKKKHWVFWASASFDNCLTHFSYQKQHNFFQKKHVLLCFHTIYSSKRLYKLWN